MPTLKELQDLLNNMAEKMPNDSLRIISVEGKKFIQKNFRDQSFTDVSQKKWKERKTVDNKGRDLTRYRSNRLGRGGKPTKFASQNKDRAILVGYNTGGNKLKNSFKTKINFSNKQVSFYTDKAYAERHNEGLDGMPKRQFMGKSQYLNKKIYEKLKKRFNELINS